MMHGTKDRLPYERVLITGASGLLGRYLLRIRPTSMAVNGSWFRNYQNGLTHHIDVTDKKSLSKKFDRLDPTVVIHCAAIGSVDYCEENQGTAWDVNYGGVLNVLAECRKRNATMVFISTNAVFDGEDPPYREDSERNPVNVYGLIKKVAEDVVMTYEHHIIVRPIMLYGYPYPGGRENWATRAVEWLTFGKAMHIVKDVMTQPTYSMDCAYVIWRLVIDKDLCKGVWHVGGMDRMNLSSYVKYVADVWGLDKSLIHEVDSSYFPSIAPRPADTTYDLSKLWDLGEAAMRPSGVISGLRRMWRESVC